MATFRVGDLIKEQPDGSRALQTTLTGSNVEKVELIYSANAGMIPTGTTVEVTPGIDLYKYDMFFIQFLPLGARTYDVQYAPRRGDTDIAISTTTILSIQNTASNQVSERYPVKGLKGGFRVINRTDVDHEFGTIFVFGVRL